MRVSTMPVTPRRSSKARAVLTASWPVSASATSSTSCGSVAALTSATSAISASSTVTRPAVSSMTTSKPPSRAASIARRAICTGDWPATIGSVSTPTCLPSTASCSIAAGRLRVERGHQHAAAAAVGEALGDLRGRRGLARTLQPHHHDGHRRHGVEIDGAGLLAEHRDELIVDDLHDHLPGRHRLQHLGADGARAHLVGERAHHLERDVGLEQRTADLAQGRVDVLLGQRAAARQLVEDA